MTEFIFQYGLFFAKAVTIVAAVAAVAVVLLNLLHHARGHSADHLEVRDLNHRFRDLADSLKHVLLTPDQWKKEVKAHKAADKARARAGKGDECVLRLESEGGVVHGYGLAASQLRRVRDAGVRLTVAVDKVAASGGYLMACVADRSLAAPFAVLGSIGVVGQLPNFNRLLKKHEIDYELHTAGEHKRTLTLFGENTEAGREKFRETLEDAHALFKDFIRQNRPAVDLEQVATGDHWFGTRALALKLVDELKTSDDYLLERSKSCDLYELRYKRHRGLLERLGAGLAQATARARATFPF